MITELDVVEERIKRLETFVLGHGASQHCDERVSLLKRLKHYLEIHSNKVNLTANRHSFGSLCKVGQYCVKK